MTSSAIILNCYKVTGKSNNFDLLSILKFTGVLIGTRAVLILHASLNREVATLKVILYVSDNSDWYQPAHLFNKHKGAPTSSKVYTPLSGACRLRGGMS